MPHDLAHHARHAYSAITDRPDFSWPDGKRLAVYIGLNLEHFAAHREAVWLTTPGAIAAHFAG